MHRSSQSLAVTLAVLLIWMTTAEAISAPQIRMTSGYAVRQQVELFGTGTEVKVKQVGGKKISGSIGAVEDDFFELTSGNSQHSKQITYFDVTEFDVSRARFQESDDTGALHARRVIQVLGVGRLIEVTTRNNKLRGKIQTTTQDHFEILLAGKSTFTDIAYADMRELRPQPVKPARHGTGLSTTAKVCAGLVLFLFVGLPLQCGLRKNCQT